MIGLTHGLRLRWPHCRWHFRRWRRLGGFGRQCSLGRDLLEAPIIANQHGCGFGYVLQALEDQIAAVRIDLEP
jgi:hypothetical protein